MSKQIRKTILKFGRNEITVSTIKLPTLPDMLTEYETLVTGNIADLWGQTTFDKNKAIKNHHKAVIRCIELEHESNQV